MLSAALLSTFHLLALAIGLPAIFLRARALARVPADPAALQSVLSADGAWGIAAILWWVTGLWRVLGNYEKGTNWYLHSDAFWLKMGIFGLLFALELWPMVTLIRWRIRQAKGQPLDLAAAPKLALISRVETALLLMMPFVASMMARGMFH